MSFNPELADIRFGCGLSPLASPPESVSAMLDTLSGPDTMAEAYPITGFDAYLLHLTATRDIRRTIQKTKDPEARKTARAAFRDYTGTLKRARVRAAAHHMARRVYTPYGFRERLVDFWADHFTAYGKGGVMQGSAAALVEDAIRPHLGARFEDMLIAAALHPVMLHYLDQPASVGPNSPAAIKRNGKLGLNENLAREILELHTLGVGGPYSQTDVRELAKLLTGLVVKDETGLGFAPGRAEPGAETILGVAYGGDTARLNDIKVALADLARHPVTHQHLAQKLAVHFVSDTPDGDLVAQVAEALDATGGDLMAGYEALLSHPAAWDPTLRNAKTPVDYVSSALRALAIPQDMFPLEDVRLIQRLLINPLRDMGQYWQRPPGPDGWPEEDSAWITPQGIATRIEWAMSVPARLLSRLPDPRQFVDTALGSYASDAVRFAASAAESKPEAIGLVLSSPAFQRR